jgi:hypothetical protein
MRLLCVHQDTIRDLQQLHTPFDDVTPASLWGTPYHLIGVSAEQRDVLRNFDVELQDITPKALDRASLPANPTLTTDAAMHDGQRIRTTYRGKYLEATVQNGKVQLGDRAFDSPASASQDISGENVWTFWEYFDESAGDWQVLGQEWRV